MSKLESFIRRMQAQIDCIEVARGLMADVPGVIFELGLGNGRSFDHLRETFPDRDIYVFEDRVHTAPEYTPDDEHLMLGDVAELLPKAVERFRGQVALVHCDVGTADPAYNQLLARMVGVEVLPALCANAVVMSHMDLHTEALAAVELPSTVYPGRYFLYRNSLAGGQSQQTA
jgi:hypothetical protein